MKFAVDLFIIAALVLAAIHGTRRGMVRLTLELNGYIIATLLALALYSALGNQIHEWLDIIRALANVTAFVFIWVITELGYTALTRFRVLPYIDTRLHETKPNRFGGGILQTVKVSVFLMFVLVAYDGLPLPTSIKDPVVQAALPRQLLSSGSDMGLLPSTGIGRDFSESLAFFTVPAEVESTKFVQLGYTTTNFSVAPRAENEMLTLINRERAAAGLKPLTINGGARTVARAHSADMFSRGYFSHLNPDGHTPFDRLRAGNVKYLAAGENLALAPTLELAHKGLMNSPGHRANILSKDFGAVGIGIVDAGPNGLMVTQNFTN